MPPGPSSGTCTGRSRTARWPVQAAPAAERRPAGRAVARPPPGPASRTRRARPGRSARPPRRPGAARPGSPAGSQRPGCSGGPAAGQPERPQRGPLRGEHGLRRPGRGPGRRAGVDGHVRGDVPGAVRDRPHRAAVPVPGQRPASGLAGPAGARSRRPAPGPRSSRPITPPTPRSGTGPARRARPAGAAATSGAARPGRRRRRPARCRSAPVPGSTSTSRGPSGAQLHHVQRDVVQPLAGDDQPGDPVPAARPPSGSAGRSAPGGRGATSTACAAIRSGQSPARSGRPGRAPGSSSSPWPAPTSTRSSRGGWPSAASVCAEQGQHRRGVPRRGVHRGAEVRGRALAPGVEPAAAVERLLHGRPPGHPHPADSSARRGGTRWPRAGRAGYADHCRPAPGRGLEREGRQAYGDQPASGS